MSSAAANRVREQLGNATGIVVRTSKKYLHRGGVEVVPVEIGFQPAVRVFYRGTESGVVKQNGFGLWSAVGRQYARLDAAVLTLVANDLQSSRQH